MGAAAAGVTSQPPAKLLAIHTFGSPICAVAPRLIHNTPEMGDASANVLAKGMNVWIPNPADKDPKAAPFLAAQVVSPVSGTQARVALRNGTEVSVDVDKVDVANTVTVVTDADERSEPDNCSLLHLSEATLLHNTQLRFQRDEIYTLTGQIVTSLNPCKQLPALYDAAATLHGRTRAQRYSRLADWRYIRRCAAVASPSGLPLVGNGDVFSFKDYERHMRGGTLATCMIGRGALIKPWVLTEIKERRVWDISASERLAIFGDFARHGLEHWGSDERGVETTRRFMMEWMSYTHRYVPVGLLESGVAQKMHLRPVPYSGRNELETLLASDSVEDWSRVTEMFLGKPAPGFSFVPKHKSNSYSAESAVALASAQAAGYDDDVEENG